MKRLIAMLLCMMLCVSGAGAETEAPKELTPPNPLMVSDYLAAFERLTAALNMPEEMLSWKWKGAEQPYLMLYLAGEELSACVTVEGEEITAVTLAYQDFPGNDTQRMFLMLTLLSAGPTLIAGGATADEAMERLQTDVFDAMPEDWYTENGVSYRGPFGGKNLMISVAPDAEDSYRHSLLMFLSDKAETAFYAGLMADETKQQGSDVPEELVFPSSIKLTDYLAAAEEVIGALSLIADDTKWVQSTQDSGLWYLEAGGEPFGITLRTVGGEVDTIGVTITEERDWADQIIASQMLYVAAPLAVLSGMSVQEALNWCASRAPYERIVAGDTDIARDEAYYGIPMSLLTLTQRDGTRTYDLLLQFREVQMPVCWINR